MPPGKQECSLRDRLAKLAKKAHNRAEATPPGAKRAALIRAARISETAAYIQEWINSRGLRAPE
jgi:hypothetical protein